MKAPGQFPLLAVGYPIRPMKTVEEIRVARLEQLIEEAGGSIQAVADRMKRTHSQISQLKTMAPHSVTKKPRTIGSDLAREFELAFGKPRGWMDHEESSAQASDAEKWRETAHEIAGMSGQLELPLSIFIKFIDWYMTYGGASAPRDKTQYTLQALQMLKQSQQPH